MFAFCSFRGRSQERILAEDHQHSCEIGIGGKHQRVIVGQLDDRRKHLVRLPTHCDSAFDQSGEFQVERILASNEAVRIVRGNIRRYILDEA
jgi:hypothetical protein